MMETIYKAFHGVVTISEIGKLLKELNIKYSNQMYCRPHSVYSVSVIEKCRKNNLWLFLERAIPFVHMQQLYEEVTK